MSTWTTFLPKISNTLPISVFDPELPFTCNKKTNIIISYLAKKRYIMVSKNQLNGHQICGTFIFIFVAHSFSKLFQNCFIIAHSFLTMDLGSTKVFFNKCHTKTWVCFHFRSMIYEVNDQNIGKFFASTPHQGSYLLGVSRSVWGPYSPFPPHPMLW